MQEKKRKLLERDMQQKYLMQRLELPKEKTIER